MSNSPKNRWLEFAWRRLRGQLETLAEAQAQAFDSGATAHTKPGSSSPKGDSDLAHFDRRWRRATSNEHRRSMLLCMGCAEEDAKAGGAVRCCVIGCLRSYMLTSADPSLQPNTKEWRERVANEDMPASLVAHKYAIRKSRVLACRREFKTERQHGGARNGAGRKPKVAA